MPSSASVVTAITCIASFAIYHGYAFTTSPAILSSPVSTQSTSALFIFGRKSRRAKQQQQAEKKELKIVELDQVGDNVKLQVSVTELRKIFDNVDELLQGGVASTSAGSVAPPKVVSSSSLITQEDVLAAHKAWGDGLCLISKTHEEKGYEAAKKVAQEVLDAAYGYAKGIPVLFKPTLASGKQTFRLTNEGALSYFVGGFPEYPNDGGFAIMGWRKVESKPAGILLLGDTALSTGNVYCTNKSGKTTVVDKTWGYMKDDEGKVRIILHHSSLPYSA